MNRGLAALAAVLAFLVYLPAVWRVPFYSVPEPLEALVVWEMSASGDWVLPRRNGSEIPAKPPLYHWIAATIAALRGGVDDLTARLPSLLLGAAGVGVVFAAGAAASGTTAGAIAALALATSPEWVRWAVTARTDATFAFFAMLAFLAAERWLTAPATGKLVAFGAATGAAVLSKGPAGLLLPAIVFAAEAVRRRRLRELRPVPVALAALVFVAIAGSWYAAAALRGGPDFVEKQIVAENLLRFFPKDDGGPSREHSMLFYVPSFLAGMAPWSLVAPLAIVAGWRRRDDRDRFLVVWIAVVFLVCTAASGKRTNYILPLYPAAALLVGRELALRFEGAARPPAALRFLAASLAAAGALVAAVLVAWRLGFEPWQAVLPLFHVRDQAMIPAVVAAIGSPPVAFIGGIVVLAVGLVVAIRSARPEPLAIVLAVTVVFTTLVGTAVARPTEARLRTLRPFAERVAERVPPAESLRFYRRPDYVTLFYLRRHVPVEYVDFASIPSPGWALVWEDDWRKLGAGVDRAERGGSGAIGEAQPRSGEHRTGPPSRWLGAGPDSMEVVDESPRSAPHRDGSRLFLVRLGDDGNSR